MHNTYRCGSSKLIVCDRIDRIDRLMSVVGTVLAKRLQAAAFQVSLGYGKSDGTIVGLSCYMYVNEMEEHLLSVSYGRVDLGTGELRLPNIESTLPQFDISFFFLSLSLFLSLCLSVSVSLSVCLLLDIPPSFLPSLTSFSSLLLLFFLLLLLLLLFYSIVERTSDFDNGDVEIEIKNGIQDYLSKIYMSLQFYLSIYVYICVYIYIC